MKRYTVNLSDEDARALEPFLVEDSPERAALARKVGEEALSYSDSAVLRALALEGRRVIRGRMLEEGYAALAASLTEEERKFADASLRMAAETWTDD